MSTSALRFGGCPCSAGKPMCDCGLVPRMELLPMKRYFATLWAALCGASGYSIVKTAELNTLRLRVARYEHRAAGQRKARERAVTTKEATQ